LSYCDSGQYGILRLRSIGHTALEINRTYCVGGKNGDTVLEVNLGILHYRSIWAQCAERSYILHYGSLWSYCARGQYRHTALEVSIVILRYRSIGHTAPKVNTVCWSSKAHTALEINMGIVRLEVNAYCTRGQYGHTVVDVNTYCTRVQYGHSALEINTYCTRGQYGHSALGGQYILH